MTDIFIRKELLATDCVPLYVWRTDEYTRRYSRSPAPTWDEHCRWFEHERIRPLHLHYVAQIDPTKPVGIASLGHNGFINIMISPAYRRQGVGLKLLQHLQIVSGALAAEIVIGNTPSLKLFIKAGFEIEDTTDRGIVLTWRAPHGKCCHDHSSTDGKHSATGESSDADSREDAAGTCVCGCTGTKGCGPGFS